MHLRVFPDTTHRTLSFFHLILYTSLLTLYYVKASLIESIHQDHDRCEMGSTVVTQHQMSVEFYLQEYTAITQGGGDTARLWYRAYLATFQRGRFFIFRVT